MNSKTEVLLITPPSRKQIYQSLSDDFAAIEPPVWSSLIANFLTNNNINVEILDAEAEQLTHEQTAKVILKKNPKLAVFVIYGQQPSASTQCMPGGKRVVEILKNEKSEIKTIVMGTHASSLPKKTLEEEGYDFVCQGEGPHTILGLIEIIKKNKSDLSKIPGLWYYDKDKEISFNTSAKLIANLDETLNGQSWDLLDMSKYKAHNWHVFNQPDTRNSYASLQTSLGCPFKCTFCCINSPFNSNQIRFWSPKHIVNQMEYLVKKYSIKNIKIPDEMFVLNPRQVSEICDLIIQKGLKLNIWAYARIDTLEDIEMLKKMKKAGFNWLAIGVESGSKHVRDGVIKGRFTTEKIYETISRVKDLDFYIGANYIFGLPDDDHGSMQETLDMAIKINSEWINFYCAMAYPGSQLHKMAVEKKWDLPENKNGPGWLGYSQHAYETRPLRTEKIKASEVLDFRDKAFNIYFQNPDYMKMAKDRFGENMNTQISSMLKHKLKRKHQFEEVDY